MIKIIKEGVSWAKSGFPVADAELQSTRLALCKECPYFSSDGFAGTGKCRVCGCSTKAKLILQTSQCPKGKW